MRAQILNAVQIAQAHVASTDATAIVLELSNQGTGSRMGRTFTSLDNDVLDAIDQPVFLVFESWNEAVEAFQTLTAEGAENNSGQLVSGTITLVSRPYGKDDGVETRTWDMQDGSRPVFRNGIWNDVEII